MKSYLEQALEQAEQKIDKGDFRKGLGKLEDAYWNFTLADSVEEFDRIRGLAERVAERTEGRLAEKARALVGLTEERETVAVPNRSWWELGVLWSVLSMLLASLVAIGTWIHVFAPLDLFCSTNFVGVANIRHGLVVALFGGLAGPVLILFVRKRRRLLTAALLLVAATLTVAIAFVALDSAAYRGSHNCSFNGTPEGGTLISGHVYYLYVLWGMAVAFLLWAAAVPWIKPRLRARASVFKARGRG